MACKLCPQFLKKLNFLWSEWNVVAEYWSCPCNSGLLPSCPWGRGRQGKPGGRGGRGAVSRQFQLLCQIHVLIHFTLWFCDSFPGHSRRCDGKNCSVADRSTAGGQAKGGVGWAHRPWDSAWLSQGSCSIGASGLWSIWASWRPCAPHPGEIPAELADTPQVLGEASLYQLRAGPDDVDFLCYSQHACI